VQLANTVYTVEGILASLWPTSLVAAWSTANHKNNHLQLPARVFIRHPQGPSSRHHNQNVSVVHPALYTGADTSAWTWSTHPAPYLPDIMNEWSPALFRYTPRNFQLGAQHNHSFNPIGQSPSCEASSRSVKNKNTVAWVRERTTPTEESPLVGEVSANFCG
jgi:hypothetical protein